MKMFPSKNLLSVNAAVITVLITSSPGKLGQQSKL